MKREYTRKQCTIVAIVGVTVATLATGYAVSWVTQLPIALALVYGALIDDYEVVDEEYKPLSALPHFSTYARAITGIMSQPLVSLLPGGYPLMPICSNFDKRWSTAVVRPLRTRVSIHRSFVTGLPTGTFPGLEGWQDSIAELPWGGFEALAQWRLTVPYPCQLWQPYPEEG